ncbi:MAG: GC-type dockerin domain-anchored protein [Phycisphaerales bacterium JB064]
MLTAICGLAIAGAALAQETRSVVAYETGTIQAAGPRPAPNGDRYMNMEGESFAPQFRSYGTARWDLGAIKAEFDTIYPEGWTVTEVALEMTQDNASFTADGFVDVVISTDDSTDCKTALSPLSYPFFDDGVTPDLALASDTPILSFLFFEISTGTIDRYDQVGGPGGSSESLTLSDDLVNEIENDSIMTWVFLDAEPGVAATYRGQEPFEGREGPKLFITVESDGGTGCRADLDGDGSLTIFDFLQFQNLFDSGDLTADFDGDGSLTLFDFLAFQNEFDAGC